MFQHCTLKMNSYTAVVLLLVAVASVVQVAIAADPDCNSVTPLADFDSTKMAGFWYMLYVSTSSGAAKTYTCMNETNDVTSDGNFTTITRMHKGSTILEDKYLGTPTDDQKAKLKFIDTKDSSDAGATIVLGTDYDKYSVRLSCYPNIGNRIEVMSKYSSIDDSTLTTAKSILKDNKLDTDLSAITQNCG